MTTFVAGLIAGILAGLLAAGAVLAFWLKGTVWDR